MAEKEKKELQAREKAEVSTPAEQTRPGPAFTPAVDIFETDQEITVLADMPGVKAKDLAIDLRENTLTLSGDVESPEGETEEEVLREYRTGNYYRQFTLSDVIDQSKIEAALKDGVLRLRLPKVEAAAPRTIPVKTG
ncbi:MAG: Hsp20/alpha crystallin family protein [Deltaproteobacteria bacterium]|nr:Hsp20/alpha crystallin family protein [Deltaproteobacteria bacterium]MBW2078157.1 Hsp20/alpha crystallin family protein [Deltaproteobacteria bacterium]MBW2312192.1 Hsp20/alpha crystallin family protein [Deltaproteobacteria bacterium]